MTESLLDSPLIRSVLFHPRKTPPGGGASGAIDGTVKTDQIEIGYRLFGHRPDAPVILLFHGNGEIASDYDYFADAYHEAGASLIVADFRGYGWSSGDPRVTTLLPDAEAVADALPDILREHGLDTGPRILMGRSLGSLAAVHLAHRQPAAWAGLIIESGIAYMLPLLARLGLPAHLLEGAFDPFNNSGKISETDIPLLVIHGERDMIVPVENGQALYDASPSARRTLLRVPGAGHNDLLMVAPRRYFDAIADFINSTERDSDG